MQGVIMSKQLTQERKDAIISKRIFDFLYEYKLTKDRYLQINSEYKLSEFKDLIKIHKEYLSVKLNEEAQGSTDYYKGYLSYDDFMSEARDK